jgi:small conductance mechanosensitive channel
MEGELRDNFRHATEQFIQIGFGLLQAIIVFFIASIVARALRRLVRSRLEPTLAPANTKHIVEDLVTFGVFGGAATLLLALWGVTWTTLLTAIGLSTLVVALGLQSVLQSLIAGVFILFERPFSVGDHVSFSIHEIGGTVEEITLRTTVIRAEDGTRIVAPNTFVLTHAVINFSPDRAMLTIIRVHGAGSGGRTMDETRRLVEAAITDVPGLTTRPDIAIHSRWGWLRVPRLLARIPRVGPWATRVTSSINDQTTTARVSWTGLNVQHVREEVVRRLEAAFPDARIRVRRW